MVGKCRKCFHSEWFLCSIYSSVMSRLNVELKDGLHRRFREQAEEDGRKESDVIRMLILDWVENRVRQKYSLKDLEGAGGKNEKKRAG